MQFRRKVCTAAFTAFVAACSSAPSHNATTPTSTTAVRSRSTAKTDATAAATTTTVLSPAAADSFTANPTTAAIGDRITFRGKGCSGKEVEAVLSGGVLLTGIRPDASGTWSVTFVVSDRSSAIGRVEGTAACMPGSPRDRYKPIFVEVTTYRHLEVAPGHEVHAGDTLDVTGVGRCPEGGAITVELDDATGTLATGTPGSYPIRADRQWAGPFVVPATARPGRYSLRAGCVSRTWGVIPYTPLPITVRGGG